MADIIPFNNQNQGFGGLSRTSQRSMERTEQQAIVQLHGLAAQANIRRAVVQAEAAVAVEKLREAAHLVDVGMSEHTILSRKAALYANGDPMLADELQFFVRSHQLVVGQILGDTVERLRHV